MRNDSIIITRGQIGQWASYIGGTSLLLGLVGLIWQGGLSPIIIGLILIGVLGIALWAVIAPQEFTGFFTGRQTRYGTMAVFGTLILIGIVATMYVILQRSVITMDMTEGLRFSISNETQQILRRIERPIRITGFYSPRMLQMRELDDQFFRLYETATNGLISREYVDPNEQPSVAARYSMSYDGQVFISYVNTDGTIDFSSLMPLPRTESQERDMTEAIARLLLSGTIKVYFEVGHGELDIRDGEQRGLSGINNGIQASGLITLPLDLTNLASTGGDVPLDAAAIIMVRPTTDLSDGEIAVLDRYLKAGGALFIMADVLYNQDAFLRQDGAFNQYLWNNFGLRALDAVIVDAGASAQTPLDIISAAIFQDNQITQRMDSENSPAVFSLSRVVEVNEDPPDNVPNGRVIMSSTQSYGETNLQALGETNSYAYDEGQDLVGPLASAVWAYNEQTGGKILLVGDSDWVTNGLVSTEGNAILFTDGLSWLTGFGEQVSFMPQTFTTGLPVVFLDGATLDLIAFVTVILMPGIVLATGLIVWTRRMRA